jgi:hypothetical protein
MAQQPDFPPNPSEGGEDSSSRSGWLYWLLAVCVAILLHLLVGYALFVAALPCAQAAWKSFRCGFWLLRADPVAARGRACCWFCLAVGCWKAAATALAVMLILIGIEAMTGRPMPIQQAQREGNFALLIMGVGVSLSTLIGIIAIALALRGRVRVWVHPSLRQRCRGEFGYVAEYVLTYRNRQMNHAVSVVALSVLFPLAAAGTGLLMWLGYNHPNNDAPAVLNLIGFLLLMAGPLAMIPVYVFLSSRVIARTPLDCWPVPSIIPALVAAMKRLV